MRKLRSFAGVFLFALLATLDTVAAGEFDGTYHVPGEASDFVLVLASQPDGRFTGSVLREGTTYEVFGTIGGPSLIGRIAGYGIQAMFVARIEGDRLFMQVTDLDSNGRPIEENMEVIEFVRKTVDVDKTQIEDGATGTVAVNGRTLDGETLVAFRQRYRVQIQPGRYWYDHVSGAWGLEGGPTAGFLQSNLDLGGPLQADASGGDTGVFINGREIHEHDLWALQQVLGPIQPGPYGLDGQGNVYSQDGQWLFNLLQRARRRGGGTIYRSNITGLTAGGDGSASYVMGKDWSVMIGN